jgi:hypothetical protein
MYPYDISYKKFFTIDLNKFSSQCILHVELSTHNQ